jgi:hypothetical protein
MDAVLQKVFAPSLVSFIIYHFLAQPIPRLADYPFIADRVARHGN